MCKLLALKANEQGCNREELVFGVLKTLADMSDHLPDDIKLLALQWVDCYSKIAPKTLEKIKKEVNMSYEPETITDYYRHEGKLEGKLESLESLYKEGILAEDLYKQKIVPLKDELARIHSQNRMSV